MIYLQWIHADSSWLPCHPQKLPGTEVRLTEIRPLCPPSCSLGVIIAFFQVSGTSPDLHNLSKVIWWLASLWCGPALVDESCQGPWTSRPQVCPGVSRIHPSWPRESLPSNIPLSWICESKILLGLMKRGHSVTLPSLCPLLPGFFPTHLVTGPYYPLFSFCYYCIWNSPHCHWPLWPSMYIL